MLRVNRTSIALQQPRTAEKPGAIPQPGQGDALVRGGFEHVGKCLIAVQFSPVAATHHQHIQRVELRHIKLRIGPDHQPQVTDHLALRQAESLGGKQPWAQQVGGDQGIQRLGKRWQRKVLKQDKTHAHRWPVQTRVFG